MRRRRARNPLLMRIVWVSILIHMLLLPILAHFGAFKKIQQHFMETQLITLPPPTPEPQKPEPRKKPAAPHKPTPTAKKSQVTSSHQRQSQEKTHLSQPKVMANSGGSAGPGEGPTVEANGTGKVGQVPTEETGPTTPPVAAPPPPQPAPQPAQPAPPPPPQPKPRPQPAPPPPPQPVRQPEPAPPPPPPREPVITEAAPIDSPQPTIPDDLRSEDLDKTFVVEFTVAPDGTASDVRVVQTTGNDELDHIALDTARRWRFKPATRDGVPIESKVRLHIEFQVN